MSAGVVLDRQEIKARLAGLREQLGEEADPFALVWEAMPLPLRDRILTAAGMGWVGASGAWHMMPPQCRGVIKNNCIKLRDMLLRVFPLEDSGPGVE